MHFNGAQRMTFLCSTHETLRRGTSPAVLFLNGKSKLPVFTTYLLLQPCWSIQIFLAADAVNQFHLDLFHGFEAYLKGSAFNLKWPLALQFSGNFCFAVNLEL